MIMGAGGNNLPLIELFDALRSAERDRWTGELRAEGKEHLEGIVVFNEGRVAWAVCSAQHEDLGTFLWRLGRITREQLVEIRKQYQANFGSKKLGALLEEAGLIRRTVLERCLLLHTRMALTTLTKTKGLRWQRTRGHIQLEDDVGFSLDDLLPELAGANEIETELKLSVAAGNWSNWNVHNAVLRVMEEVPGYRGALVVARNGAITLAHLPDSSLDAMQLGVSIVSIIEVVGRGVRSYNAGELSTMSLECSDLSIIVNCALDGTRHCIVLLLDVGAQLGHARFKLGTLRERVAKKLARIEELDRKTASSLANESRSDGAVLRYASTSA
jgi:predicted regulator of Ras-like GTPase activity (Roadblock/LC7/MglB family)